MKSSRLYFIILIILSTAFIAIFYGKVLVSPNSFMFSTSGDGMKNYFTYAWHIKYDSSAIEFQGMNYPYGEHFMYTDCHPIFTLAFRALKPIFPGIVDYSVGFLNFFMIFSFVLTALFLWLIFKDLKVDPFFSILGSLGIMMLAPQVFRLTGHLALSYSFFIPLTLYLALKHYGNTEKKRWLWFQMLNIFFWFFIHAYLGMMAAGFLLAFWVIHFIKNFKTLKSQIAAWLPLFLWVILPVLCFVLFVNLTDTHTGRTPNPSGFFLHNAEPDDLLVPIYPPLRPLIDQFAAVNQKWEAWAYLGLTTIIMIITLLVPLVKNLARGKGFRIDSDMLPAGNFRIAIWSSVILLIFAFGFPFKAIPGLIDYFPVIKQFRATGRFDWVFFFVATIMAVVMLDHWLRRSIKYNLLRKVLVIAALLFIMVEGIPYHWDMRSKITQSKNLFEPSNLDQDLKLVLDKIDPADYQAILPLPFYYIGSENFSVAPQDVSVRNSIVASFYTGLPITGAYLTRTGIEESKRIVELVSPAYYRKPIQQDIPSLKPFLVVVSPGNMSENQVELKNKGVEIARSQSIGLYSLSLDTLFANTASIEIEKFEALRESLHEKDGFLTADTDAFLYFDSFDTESADTSFSEPGAFTGVKKGIHTLAGFYGGTFEAGKTYTASVWMYNAHLDALNFWFRLMAEEYDEPNNRYIEHWVLPEQSEVINGNWSLVEIEFTVENPQNYFALKLRGKDIDHAWFIADDLLIREKGIDVYRVEKTDNGKVTLLFKNNDRIKRD
ncbi:MAG: hypothetical protein KQI35_07955 [Bacteroidetes bacterium]|nr:hypothetical protein [Bacteroidota bacterium]